MGVKSVYANRQVRTNRVVLKQGVGYFVCISDCYLHIVIYLWLSSDGKVRTCASLLEAVS